MGFLCVRHGVSLQNHTRSLLTSRTYESFLQTAWIVVMTIMLRDECCKLFKIVDLLIHLDT